MLVKWATGSFFTHYYVLYWSVNNNISQGSAWINQSWLSYTLAIKIKIRIWIWFTGKWMLTDWGRVIAMVIVMMIVIMLVILVVMMILILIMMMIMIR